MAALSRTEGFEASAQRIERVLEVVRGEMGKTAKETDWAGLAGRLATGAAETKALALELAGSQSPHENDAFIHTFVLRQLEINLALISKLSSQITMVQERLDRLHTELSNLKHNP